MEKEMKLELEKELEVDLELVVCKTFDCQNLLWLLDKSNLFCVGLRTFYYQDLWFGKL